MVYDKLHVSKLNVTVIHAIENKICYHKNRFLLKIIHKNKYLLHSFSF